MIKYMTADSIGETDLRCKTANRCLIDIYIRSKKFNEG